MKHIDARDQRYELIEEITAGAVMMLLLFAMLMAIFN